MLCLPFGKNGGNNCEMFFSICGKTVRVSHAGEGTGGKTETGRERGEEGEGEIKRETE